MPNLIYPWHRRWLSSTATYAAVAPPYQPDETGYVDFYEWGPGLRRQPIGYALADLTERQRCVVLLGDPGIGKSQEWRRQRELVGSHPRQIFLNLGTIDSEQTLRTVLLEIPQVQSWRADDSVLSLWLDSLDEGLLHLATLQAALLRVLQSLPLDRLCLRIICRNAVWPVSFSEDLAKLMAINPGDSEQFKTLLLSPLSREQVAEAAMAEQLDEEAFLAAVAVTDAQPLASRPVTLALLLRLYQPQQQGFSATEIPGRAGLYVQGCLTLCDRPNRARPEEHRRDPYQRLLLAGYVAFLSVLTNRRILLAELTDEPLNSTELDPNAMGGGPTATWRGQQALISAGNLRDIFRHTGLFTDLGSGRLVWAHQSYAEFLAAWYISLTELPPSSLRPLFRSAADPQGGIVPALRETTGWLADLQPAFWEELLELDPLALLATDLRSLGPEQRAKLVQRLLVWAGGLAAVPFQSPDFLRQLQHPDLAGQLAPVLRDSAAPAAAANLAVDLARAVGVRDLQPLLLAQALDPAESFPLRLRALTLLVDLADDPTRATLRSLLPAIPPEDEADEFRGTLLKLLWPNHLSLDELFGLLLPYGKGPLFGTYNQFLDQLLDLRLDNSPARVLTGLTWLATHTSELKKQDSTKDFWQQVAHQLQRAAWQLAGEDERLVAALADGFSAHVAENRPFVLGGTAVQRVAVVAELLRRSAPPEPMYVLYHSADSGSETLIKEADWDGVYSLLTAAQPPLAQQWLSETLLLLLRDTPTTDSTAAYNQRFEQVAQAGKMLAPVQQALSEWAAPIDQFKADNQRIKEQYYAEITRRQTAAKERIAAQHIRRRRTQHRHWKMNQLVGRIRLRPASPPTFDSWVKLLHYLSREKREYGFSEAHDPTSTRRWAKRHPASQAALLTVAWHFLGQFPVPPPDWYQLGHGTKGYGIYLYRTLLMCYSLQPKQVAELPGTFWENWAAFVLHALSSSDRQLASGLLQLAAQAAPAAVDAAVVRQLAAYYERADFGPYNLGLLTKLLPAAGFSNQLLQAVAGKQWPRAAFNGRVLTELLKGEYAPVWEYIRALEPLAPANTTSSAPVDETLVEVYHWLLFDRQRPQADQWEWWQRLMQWPATGAAVLSKALRISAYSVPRFWGALTEEQLATLTRWLTHTYQLQPGDTDNWQTVGPVAPPAAARTAIVAELADRGTETAVQLLRDLQAELGSPPWLGFRLDQAREKLRRLAWEPPLPEVLASLSRETSRRWVQSASDLQDLLLESLDRFQADLQGEPTTAEVLWIPERAKGGRIEGHKVRDENFFSNVLRQHFRQDLQRANLLIKRELEIRPSLGVGTGQRTDIFVEAFTRGPANEKIAVVTVVVEVKLSGNAEAETGLYTQLRGYLADQAYKHGIFLVGWHFGQFGRRPAARLDQEELLAQLNRQAAALASTYHIKAKILDIRLPADTGRASK